MNRQTLYLALGAICISFAAPLVKLITLGPTTVAFYRCLFGGVTILLLSRFSKNTVPSPSKRLSFPHLLLVLLGGLFFAADLYFWHRSIRLAGAGLATILANTQVFYLTLVGLLALKESLSKLFLVSVGIAFLGISLLVQNTQPGGQSDFLLGVGFGLATGIVYAAYIFCMRRIKATSSAFSQTENLGYVTLVGCLFLGILCFFENSLALPSVSDLIWLLVLAWIAQTLGWVLITNNLPKLPISKSALILLGQPTLSTLWGFLLFHEHLSVVQILGAALTLLGIYLGTLKGRL